MRGKVATRFLSRHRGRFLGSDWSRASGGDAVQLPIRGLAGPGVIGMGACRFPVRRNEQVGTNVRGMALDSVLHHRRSIRLPGYDYTLPGAYFITIVTHQRVRLFGRVVNRRMRLGPLGEIVRDEWLSTVMHRPRVSLDAFVVMPDHFHGIVIIRDGCMGDDRGVATDRRGTARRAPTVACIDNPPARRAPINATDIDGRTTHESTVEHFGRPVPGSIPTIVRSFKSAVTKRINESRSAPGQPVWQRSYYERIIRSRAEFLRIRGYIIHNPLTS